MMKPSHFAPQLTADGSFTFFSDEFGETFHSCQGAKQEAELKFIEPTQIKQKAHQPSIKLLDICYGLGYNSASALANIWVINPHCQVELIGLELDVKIPQTAIAHQLLDQWSEPIPMMLAKLAKVGELQTKQLTAKLLIGDARVTIQQVCNMGFKADAIFLDPFSGPKCPQLWTVEFLGKVADCLTPTGHLATYSCAASVRTALLKTGLKISSTTPVGRRSPGTLASFICQDEHQLSLQEQEHLVTRAAIPYRDPNLSDPPAIILNRRTKEQQICDLEHTSHWKKRWLNQ